MSESISLHATRSYVQKNYTISLRLAQTANRDRHELGTCSWPTDAAHTVRTKRLPTF